MLPNAGSTNLVTLWDTEGHRAAVFNWVCDPTNCPPPDVKINGFCNTDPNDWVRIKNNSTQTVDLTDWWVKTSRHWHYYFPDGTLLPAGATIRLWTGTGTDTSTNLYWGLPSPIFKATGEIVQLFTSRSVLAGGDYAFDQYSGNC